jgi:hypothetical protein
VSDLLATDFKIFMIKQAQKEQAGEFKKKRYPLLSGKKIS